MTGPGRIIIDGRPIPFGADDSVAVAMMRAGLHPNQGGTLCLAGDCWLTLRRDTTTDTVVD